MKKRGQIYIPGGLALAEQAVHLLRQKAGTALMEYYIGSLPFALALLYFWSDMATNPTAYPYCAPASAGLALLFIWMKYWHVRFSRRLMASLRRSAPEPWPLKRSLITAARHSALHATGAIVLPVSILAAFPLGWVYAFYQNLCAMDEPQTKGGFSLARKAVSQSALWPVQNHMFLLIMSFFTLLVFINLGFTLINLPYLLKILLGIQTVFTLSIQSMLNTTFLAILCVLSYLCVDPIIKAAYVLRCFHGHARHTGDDIRAGLHPFLKAVVFIALWTAWLPADCFADHFAPEAEAQGASHRLADGGQFARQLNEELEKTLQQRRFSWRLPREKIEEDKKSGWLHSFVKWIKEKLNNLRNAIYTWLDKLFQKSRSAQSGSSTDWRDMHKLIFYLMSAILLIVLFYWVYYWFAKRKPREQQQDSAPKIIRVDISDENITAQDLPTERWLCLAAQLMENGAFRRALRAFYLSILSILADSRRVVIKRYKSNQDYYYELLRRAHCEPEVIKLFHHCMGTFEKAWYGMHPVSRQQLNAFIQDQQRIRSLVQQSS
ncbi:MAG: hypothetical protein GY874_11275 [Desulfobacteraceae bacterium]|nr:hypothetical protein [Desulfobacteraceae bacterium]